MLPYVRFSSCTQRAGQLPRLNPLPSAVDETSFRHLGQLHDSQANWRWLAVCRTRRLLTAEHRQCADDVF